MAQLGLSRALADSPAEWIALCRRAEQAGIASAHPADLAGGDCFVDAAITLSATERLPVVISVALPTRSAVQTASAAVALAVYTPGRLTLGLGIGNQYLNETVHGVAYDPPLPRLREFAATIRTLFRAPAGQPVSLAGEYLRTNGTGFGLDVPIVIGGHGPAMVRLATQFDGLLVHLLTPLDLLRKRAALARASRAARGASDRFWIGSGLACSVDPDESVALRRARAEVAAALAIPRFLPRLVELAGESIAARFSELVAAGEIANAAASLPEDVVRQFIPVATPERLHEALGAIDYVDTVIPVSVGLFAMRFPALGLRSDDVTASRRWLLSALRLA